VLLSVGGRCSRAAWAGCFYIPARSYCSTATAADSGIAERPAMPARHTSETRTAAITERAMSLGELAHRCREARPDAEDAAGDDACYELFRRAVCQRDELAWELVVVRWRGLVLSYARQHPSWPLVAGDADDWATRTFERFWKAVGPDRFDGFPNLPALLKYLKMCAHSAVLNAARTVQAGVVPLEDAADVGSNTVEPVVVDTLATEALWRTVEAELRDESERLVAYLSFVLDLKPSEIVSRHPDRFADAADVYRVKRNVIDRLRRNPDIRGFMQ
jgi:hypothetical protein